MIGAVAAAARARAGVGRCGEFAILGLGFGLVVGMGRNGWEGRMVQDVGDGDSGEGTSDVVSCCCDFDRRRAG